MSKVGQVYYNIVDNNSGGILSSDINIFSDIVSAYGAQRFTKLGIQAPPGTKIIMNNNKTIMVGRTGIYELDEGITITSMYFIKPLKYIKDETGAVVLPNPSNINAEENYSDLYNVIVDFVYD